MSQMVLIFHPLLPETQLPLGKPKLVALSSVDDHAARGWLLVDPDVAPPAPATPYPTRAELQSQIEAGTGPIGVALRAASVAAVQQAIEDGDIEVGADGAALLDPGYDVVLALGQSNMRGQNADLDTARYDTPDPRVFQFATAGPYAATISQAIPPLGHADTGSAAYAAGLGPDFVFARWYAAANPTRRVLIVPVAYGGTAFEGPDTTGGSKTWKVGASLPDSLYELGIQQAKAAIAAGGPGTRLAAILWHQGEQDITNSTPAATYQADLDAFVDGLRIRLAAPTVPFIVGQLPPERTTSGLGASQMAAQAGLATRRAFTAFAYGPWGSRGSDLVHYIAAGQRLLGRSYWDAYLVALQNTTAGTAQTTAPTQLAAPGGLAAVPAANFATLTWEPVTGAYAYRVEHKTTAGSTWTVGATVTGLTASVGSLTAATAYDFRVTALGRYGIGTAATTSATTEAGGGGGAGSLPADLAGHWVAADLALTDGATVSSWTDRVTAVALTPASAGASPTYAAAVAAINSKPAVIFDGVDDVLSNTAFTSPNTATAIVVARVRSLPTSGSYDLLSSTGTSAQRQRLLVTSGTYAINAGTAVTGPTANTGWVVMGGRFAAGSSTNGRAGATVFTGNAGTNTRTGVRLGANPGGSEIAPLEVAEVVIVDRVLTDTEWSDAFTYLGNRYGLTV